MADKCHAVIASDNGDFSSFSSESLEEFKKELHKRLLATKGGNIRVIINGDNWALSQPQQVFFLRGPDGVPQQLGPYEAAVYDENGHYGILTDGE